MLRMALSVVTSVSGSRALGDRCAPARRASSVGRQRHRPPGRRGPWPPGRRGRRSMSSGAGTGPWQPAGRPATMGDMLLERESPLASLTEYAAEARAGDGRLVLLSGEAGAGKSALVERL